MRREVIYMLATVILAGAVHAIPVASMTVNDGLMMHGNNDGALPDRVIVTLRPQDFHIPQMLPMTPGSSPEDDWNVTDIAEIRSGTRWNPAGGSVGPEYALPTAPTAVIPEPGMAAPLLIALGWLVRRRNTAR